MGERREVLVCCVTVNELLVYVLIGLVVVAPWNFKEGIFLVSFALWERDLWRQNVLFFCLPRFYSLLQCATNKPFLIYLLGLLSFVSMSREAAPASWFLCLGHQHTFFNFFSMLLVFGQSYFALGFVVLFSFHLVASFPLCK